MDQKFGRFVFFEDNWGIFIKISQSCASAPEVPRPFEFSRTGTATDRCASVSRQAQRNRENPDPQHHHNPRRVAAGQQDSKCQQVKHEVYCVVSFLLGAFALPHRTSQHHPRSCSLEPPPTLLGAKAACEGTGPRSEQATTRTSTSTTTTHQEPHRSLDHRVSSSAPLDVHHCCSPACCFA